jgi:hypothetical protein
MGSKWVLNIVCSSGSWGLSGAGEPAAGHLAHFLDETSAVWLVMGSYERAVGCSAAAR